MRFDNKQFESGVSTTMSTLDKFKEKLKLTDASKGLENVSAAAKKCDVSSVGDAAEKVGLKFNAMYTIADQALRNITNSAMMYGKRIVSALTIDPVKAGFSEYETQINAVQTILANTESKGKTLDDVNTALDELNKYADKTIYNFTEMTRNIGTFTAAGVDLDTSVSAIKGIANLAAVSGSTSQQASTAMYQLSQAMASGTVKLMDWNSVVNAGMGGQVFQDALKETAKVHGVAIDDIIAKQGSFRESLSEGWLTTEILTDTLAKFTGDLSEEQLKAQGYTEQQIKDIMKLGQTANDAATKVKTFSQLFDTLKEAAQSGWTQTWEILVGDFEEAKELLTGISDTIGAMIGKSAESRNELLENWKVLGGRQDLIESFKNIFEGIVSVVAPIKEAFREIFPPTTAEQLKSITEGLKNFTAKLKLSEQSSDNLKRTFKGLFAVLDIVKQIFGAIFKAIGSLFGPVGELGGGVLSLTANFGDWLVALNDLIKSSGIFTKVFGGIVTILKSIFKIGSMVVKFLTQNFIIPGWNVLMTLLEKIRESIFGVGEATGDMKTSVASAFDSLGAAIESSSFYKIFSALWKGIKTVVKAIGGLIGSLAGGLMNRLGNADFSGILDFIKTISLGSIAVFIAKFVKGFSDIVDTVGSFKESALGILDSVRGCFEAYQTQLKAGALMKIATAIAILVASILTLSFIDGEKMGTAIGAITTLFVELLTAMNVLGKMGKGAGGIRASITMTSMATALLVLSAALKVMSTMSFDEMAVGLISMTVGLGALVAAVNLLPDKKLGSAARAIKKLCTSLFILSLAIKIMSTMSWSEMGVGLITMTVGLTALVAAVNLLPKDTALRTFGLTSLATAMVILAAALKIMGTMSWKEMGTSLMTLAVSLGLFVAAINLLPRDTVLKTLGIMSLSTALVVLAAALKIMGGMSWREIGKGLLTMATSLALLVTAINLLPNNTFIKILGLTSLATSLVILAAALKIMGGMSWEEMAVGLITLGTSIGILAAGLNLMKGAIPGAAALLIATSALIVLAPVLGLLGSMKWSTIVKGLTAIATAFAIFGVAGRLILPVVPAILGLAGAMALIGAGVLAAGVGLIALGTGLAALAGGFTAIAATISVIVVGIIELVAALIVGIIKGIGEGIVAFCEVIADGAPTIARAVKEVILALCEVLIDCVPAIADTILILVAELLKSLSRYTPQIVDGLFDFLIGLINGLAENLPELIKATMNLIGAFFSGVLDALGSIDVDTLIKGIVAVGLIAGLIAALSAIVPLIPGALVGVVGMGVVIGELALVLAALGAVASLPGLEWLISKGGDLLEAIGTAIGQFVGGLVGGIAQGFTNSLPNIATDLSEFMLNLKPFIEGARMIDASTLDGVKALVGIIMSLTGANLLEGITSWITGESSISRFASQLPLLGQGIKGFADAVVGVSAESIISAVEAAKALAEMTSIIPNEGGVVGWFAGENSISKFGKELPTLGQGLKAFSDSVVGISAENIISAANAAKTLADMTATIPNEGGVVSWFAGENSISKFAEEIVELGSGLKGFSDAVTGVSPEHIIAAANAARALAEMTAILPNEGGIKAWFAGESSVSKFAGEIITLGEGLKGFSDTVVGVVPENVTAAANAAKALAEMTAAIPNEGGIVSWFAGDNSVSKFADKLPALGRGLKGFSDAVAGINPEGITAAANSAKSLAEMTSHIPNEGGIKSWFTGESGVVNFAHKLPALGRGLKGFSDATVGINPETMVASANAAKALAEMTTYIPNEGGIKAWFTGESGVVNFANELPILGKGLKGFSDSTAGLNAEGMTAAANAAKALAEMTEHIPKEGGVKAWFSGETNIANFSDKLPTLGAGLKGFSDSVAGINPENVTAAASAAKSLAEMTETVPKKTDKIITFGDNLNTFGSKIASYFKKTAGIGGDAIQSSNNAISAIKDIATIDTGKIKGVTEAVDSVVKSVKNLSKVPKDSAKNFTNALDDLAKTSTKSFVKEFENIDDDLQKAGKDSVDAFVKGVESKTDKAKKAFTTLIDKCIKAINGKEREFKTAGGNLAAGLAQGITNKTSTVVSKIKALGAQAAEAMREALNINSPSKVFRDIGYSIPEGLAVGIDKYSKLVTTSTENMATDSVSGLKRNLSRISDIINGNIDVQPAIRPVLDLSDIKSGANAIGGLFGSGVSIGATANIGAINSMMGRRNQNGTTNDVVSAINKLSKSMDGAKGDTYNFGDISYDDDSSIASAVRELVRAAKVERRV
jgi:tape measure domain-containing protein